MARDIGPDMLANLDHQLEAGNITRATYDARRVEILELIRRNRAVEYGWPEKIGITVGSTVALVAGFAFIIGGGSTFSVVLGVALIVAAFLWGKRII